MMRECFDCGRSYDSGTSIGLSCSDCVAAFYALPHAMRVAQFEPRGLARWQHKRRALAARDAIASEAKGG